MSAELRGEPRDCAGGGSRFPRVIRVVQVTHDLRIGGLQRVVVDLATHLDRRAFEVSVCALRGGGPLERELLGNGIRVTTLASTPGRVDYLAFLRLARHLRRERPEVVHTHNTQPLLDGVTAALLARVPVRVHTDHARHYPDKRRYVLAESALARFVRPVVAVSEHTKGDLLRHQRLDGRAVRVIPNGIADVGVASASRRDTLRRELGIAGRGPVLGLGVRLSPQKDISSLLQAMTTVRERHPEAVLLVAGEGELEERLRREAAELGLEYHVRFLGPRLDMPRVLGSLDLYVLPSRWEGMPLVLLEAMSAGLPLVATAVGGVPEVVVPEVNGLLVPPGEPAQLAAAINRLLGDAGLARRCGEASRRIYEEKYRIETMVRAYAALYLEQLARGARGTRR